MNDPQRLRRTLLILGFSMTGTSGLLGWLEPLNSATAPHAAAGTDSSRLGELVTGGVNLASDRWSTIEVVPCDPTSSRLLAVPAEQTPHHFHVDDLGRASRTRSWVAQQVLAEQPGVVWIAVDVMPAADNRAAPAMTANALVAALQSALTDDSTDSANAPTEPPASTSGSGPRDLRTNSSAAMITLAATN
jgi:hypothetical protein